MVEYSMTCVVNLSCSHSLLVCPSAVKYVRMYMCKFRRTCEVSMAEAVLKGTLFQCSE